MARPLQLEFQTESIFHLSFIAGFTVEMNTEDSSKIQRQLSYHLTNIFYFFKY